MDVKIDAKSDKHWVVELVGEDVGVPNLVCEALLENDDVEYAACLKEHPQAGSPKLIVRTGKGSAKDALKKAIGKAGERVTELKTALKKIREKK